MLNRTDPEASFNEAFTQLDQYLLDELLPHKTAASPKPSLPTTSSNSRDLVATLLAPTIRRPAIP
jgi:hypothetical protein